MKIIVELIQLASYCFDLIEFIIIRDFEINLNFQSYSNFQQFHLNYLCPKKHLEDLNY
jgi:hypothetical protein